MMKYDIAFLHAPSVFDFRNRDDILFAYLANSDSVHVSGIFEMPPVGLLAIKQYIRKCGFQTEFFNLAAYMLTKPEFDAIGFLKNLDSDFIGIDLHWLAHTQGALEVARIYKSFHPDTKIYLGGISASQFYEDAIQYPQIDYVIRGNDTLEYVKLLVESKNLPNRLEKIQNLVWKKEGQVIVNELEPITHPYSATVDWNEIFGEESGEMTNYNIIIPQYGCSYHCNWCGGSQYANKKEYKDGRVIEKTPQMLKEELDTLLRSNIKNHTITMINYWHENDALLAAVEEAFMNDKIQRVHISVRRLPDISRIMNLPWRHKLIIELSPDSENFEQCLMCGHGHYTMEEMESFLDALIEEVYSFEVYYMIGIPKQTKDSIKETLVFCNHLLEKYKGKRVTPYICPMLPFLDRDSIFYDHPEQFGYKIFHRSLEDYANALLSMNWTNRLNYETDCLSREELVAVTYETIRAFTLQKGEYGYLPKGICRMIVKRIDDTVALLHEITEYEAMQDSEEKIEIGKLIRKKIAVYNKQAFRNVQSQQRPLDLGFCRHQWFDTDKAFELFENETEVEEC